MTSSRPKTDRSAKRLEAENLQLRAENAELRDRIQALADAAEARQVEQKSALLAEVARLREEFAVAIEALKKLRASKKAGEKVTRKQKLAAQAEVQKLRDELNETLGALKELKKLHFGRSSERTGKKPRKKAPRSPNDEDAQNKRKAGRETRSDLPIDYKDHELSEEQRCTCTKCGGHELKTVPPEISIEFEWEPGRLRRIGHRMERAVCADCGAFVAAPSPPRVVDGGMYGPGFIAMLVVSKILDCVPLHRKSRNLARQGLQISRSTLTDQFHTAASLIEGLYNVMLQEVHDSRVVYADETRIKTQRLQQQSFIWTFATPLIVTYVYSPDRSSQTPVAVLGGSTGVLIADAYSGYNAVAVPEGRTRAGCAAHCRRKFKNSEDEEAQEVVELYSEVFAVEREAKERGILGTEEHLDMRRSRAGPAMDAIKAWCDAHKDEYLPKSPVGKAISYLYNQWEYLGVFLDDVEVAPDNNLSERMLRTIALGRKNYLFVGNEAAGKNLAMLASIVATCVLHDVNPEIYLKDILLRVQDHPASEMRDLLPDRWKLLFGSNAAAPQPESSTP